MYTHNTIQRMYGLAKNIINSGIKRVVCEKRYHADNDSINIFKEAGIDVTVKENDVVKYDNQ